MFSVSLEGNPGTFLKDSYRPLINLAALLDASECLQLLITVGGLPLLLLPLRDKVADLLPSLLPAVGMLTLSIFIFGNIFEGRVWGETVYLLAIPATLGFARAATSTRNLK